MTKPGPLKSGTEARLLRIPSTVNRPRGAKSGLSAKAREIIAKTRAARGGG